MKKRVISILLVCVLCLTAAISVAAEPLDNETTVVITQSSGQTELTPSQNESCFWEYPTLTAGQHRDDGVLWLFNKSGKDATVTLSDFHLPTDEKSRAYLAALDLTVKADGKVVYSDTYDKAAGMRITVDVPKGEKKPIYYEMGCAFTYSGECNLGDQVIYGKYSVEYHGLDLLHSWIFYVALVVVVAAAVMTFVMVRKKKSEKSA